jgi:hypothetical protein
MLVHALAHELPFCEPVAVLSTYQVAALAELNTSQNIGISNLNLAETVRFELRSRELKASKKFRSPRNNQAHEKQHFIVTYFYFAAFEQICCQSNFQHCDT